MPYTMTSMLQNLNRGGSALTSRSSIQARDKGQQGALEEDAEVAVHFDATQPNHMLGAARVSAGPSLPLLQPSGPQ